MGLWVVVVVVVGGAQVLQHNFLIEGSLQSRLAHPVLLSPNSQPVIKNSLLFIKAETRMFRPSCF